MTWGRVRSAFRAMGGERPVAAESDGPSVFESMG
jgi:hypothetical protein